MESLKLKINSELPVYSKENITWHTIDEFENLVYIKDGFEIYGNAIQTALDKYKCIKIPKREVMYLEKPIVMKSGYRLLVDDNQIISNVPGTKTCLVRNENLINGADEPAIMNNPDTDISVEGGIWDGAAIQSKGHRLQTGENPEYKGALAIMIFVNVKNLVLDRAEFKNGGGSYAVQLGCVSNFKISGLKFIKYGRDGVHVNGPASFGEICHLYGEDMDDDMVALNGWDWNTSAITFGTIENIYVHDNKSTNNEFRLLPGQKIYETEKVDCDIRNCILERLSGIYTFKLYCQPHIRNAIVKGYNDTSGTVGNLNNIWFKDIKINENRESGFNDLPVNGVFDICADCENLHFEDIEILYEKDVLKKKNMSFVSVGPLSAIWKNNSENPDDWGEVFSPDAICHVENICFENIVFADGKAFEKDEVIRPVQLKINPDYPLNGPRGGTGYGTIGNVVIK